MPISKSQYNKNRIERLKAENKCTRCARRKPQKGLFYCRECSMSHKSYMKEYNYKYRHNPCDGNVESNMEFKEDREEEARRKKLRDQLFPWRKDDGR